MHIQDTITTVVLSACGKVLVANAYLFCDSSAVGVMYIHADMGEGSVNGIAARSSFSSPRAPPWRLDIDLTQTCKHCAE